MSNKELILKIARNLFNQLGTARVTTNLIAQEAGISPGNLYYHYKDKSHIIRAVYEAMIAEWEQVYQRAEGKNLVLGVLRNFIEGNFELLWEYRFFYREVVALINADPALMERHVAISKERYQRQRLLLRQATQKGFLHFQGDQIQLDEVLTIAWIVANHYLNHLEMMGQEVHKDDFETGAELVMKVFAPYIQ